MRREIAIVVVLAAMLLVPGISRYSLVDPWETHYGEVARTMRQDHDYMHTQWRGTANGAPNDNEGFRSKPVLTFWLMAAGMTATGVADDGGFSGEMVYSTRTLIGIRIPFVLCAIAGLAFLWWMLAHLVSRRLAWIAFGVVATTPMFCLIARQAIPDMPMVACTMGAIALYILALESRVKAGAGGGAAETARATTGEDDGDRPATRALHVVLGLAGAFVVMQAVYFGLYFAGSPELALRNALNPAPLAFAFLALFAALWAEVFHWIAIPLRYLLFVLPLLAFGGTFVATQVQRVPTLNLVALLSFDTAIAAIWIHAAVTRGTAGVWAICDRLAAMRPITTMRQVYLVGCYALLGVSLLAKGPPGFTVVVAAIVLHTAIAWRWEAVYHGGLELKRGLLLVLAIALPWHVGMYFKEGAAFVDEYIFTHILSRATSGVDNSPGSFAYYTDQIGHGMWLWAALIPAALGAMFEHATLATRAGRVRVIVTLWAIAAVFVFCFVETKFHHYILPAIPALGVLVAFLVDDLVARRERLHWIYGGLAIGIVLLVCRDLMFEPDRWIEMFTYRYDRPWPSAEPWRIDPSDGVLGLSIFAVVAIAGACIHRYGVILLGVAGVAIAVWAMHWYMPYAGKHWGMRDAFVSYYSQRSIYGEKRVYFGAGQCVDDLSGDRGRFRFDTFVPDTLQTGQPMTITLQLNNAKRERITEQTVAVNGSVIAIGDHDVTVALDPSERGKVDGLYHDCKRKPQDRGRRIVRAVDAERLIGWQLYWRGENFWSGGEVWGWLPEMKTQLNAANNAEFLKYLNDRSRAPLGRRYFLITEASRARTVQNLLPTPRARETFQVIDTQSNKFSLASFYL